MNHEGNPDALEPSGNIVSLMLGWLLFALVQFGIFGPRKPNFHREHLYEKDFEGSKRVIYCPN